ncbi:hypothetical protein ACFLWV_00505 [Chloroflexota bacterium]
MKQSRPNKRFEFENIPASSVRFFRDNIINFERQSSTNFAWRSTTNRWHALVAEIMLQRTRAEQVVKAYADFTKKYDTPSDYVADCSASAFTSLGLKWREQTFRQLAEVLSKADIPSDSDNLLRLPGVGDYIASAFRSLHLRIRDCIVDSNVVRLYGRYFGFQTDGETRRKKWLILLADKLTPTRKFKDFNYGLIDFTKAICKPKPLCNSCILRDKCSYSDKLRQ